MKAPTTLIALLRAPHTIDDALEGLSALGAGALEPLLEVVLDPSESHHVREVAAQAVGRIIPQGVERLLALLGSAQGDIADLAAWGLRFNHGRTSVESALFDMLASPYLSARTNAARAIRYIHVDLQRCDPRLVAAIHDEIPSVRADALRTLLELADVGLSRYGIDDPGAVIGAARSALDDPDEIVRELARHLLDRLEGSSERPSQRPKEVDGA